MDIIKEFEKFKQKEKDPYTKISKFTQEVKKKFYAKKLKENKSENKIRQAWVSFIGHNLEKIFEEMLKEFCKRYNLKITKDKILKSNNLSKELSEVKRLVSVNFGEYMLLPDADIIIYKLNPIKIIAILSIKNSFRERYTETPYWKLKLLEDENIVINAKEYTNTSYYVAYDSNDNSQYALVMPSVNKIYTHKAGEITGSDLKQVDTQFVTFPTYNNGKLCFSALNSNATGESGASVMAKKCYDVNFFYTQKEAVAGQGVAFMLIYTPSDIVYEGLAGKATSFKIVRSGDTGSNENSITKGDYTLFNFDIADFYG